MGLSPHRSTVFWSPVDQRTVSRSFQMKFLIGFGLSSSNCDDGTRR